MPGEEIAAKAAADAVRSVASEDPSVKAQLAEIAKDTPEMQRAAIAFAQRTELKQLALLSLFRPLARLVGVTNEYFSEPAGFAADLAEKIADVPDENLTTPPPHLAIPAMTSLGYSLGEPELKEMYLNLLARATDTRASSSVHPSFAETIRQLSPDEAAVLTGVLRRRQVAVVEVRRVYADEGSYKRIFNNLIEATDREERHVGEDQTEAVWVGNWARLGLVNLSYLTSFTDDSEYDWVERRRDIREIREFAEDQDPAWEIEIEKGILSATDYGMKFIESVG